MSEGAGTASVQVKLTALSVHQTRVSSAMVNQSAIACTGAGADNALLCDYTVVNAELVLETGTLTAPIAIPIVNNNRAELTETFTVTFSAPVNLTHGTATGVVWITDDEPRAPIDPSLPGQHFRGRLV